MENANSHDYLHKIKSTVIENIRRTGRPSVEAFTTIPLGLNRRAESDAEDEEDDIDADLNRDVRMTQRQRDKEIAHDNELYDESDDEDYKNSLGVRAQPGVKRRRNITDFPNPNAATAQDIDALNGTEEINDESAVSTRHPSAVAKSRTQTPAAGEQSADEDGDVEMDEPDAPVANATSTRSQSPAGVVTPPESPPATAAAAALAPTSAPAADVAMEGVDEDTKEAIADAKTEGQSERDTENVKGEVRTEVAKD
jgi:histone deacetylase 1/2